MKDLNAFRAAHNAKQRLDDLYKQLQITDQHETPPETHCFSWLGTTTELAELFIILKENGWVAGRGVDDTEGFFKLVAACFSKRDPFGKEVALRGHNLSVFVVRLWGARSSLNSRHFARSRMNVNSTIVISSN